MNVSHFTAMATVLISGGSGMIGTSLTRHLTDRDHNVIILTRQKDKVSDHPKISYSLWDVEKGLIDKNAVLQADYIVHLAGADVMEHKWTEEYKKKILESRTKSAALIIDVLKNEDHHIKSFVSASAIGYYGADPKEGQKQDGFIESDLPANNFLGETCLLWEASVDPVTTLGIRLVKLRTGIVLSRKGGAMDEFKKPLRFGIATIFGNGKQTVSWIHVDDLSRMYCESIENMYLHGPYNAVAPQPVSQKNLMLTLAAALRHRFYVSVNVPVFLIKLLKGKRSIEILKSTTVSSKKIKATRFTFLYPTIESAIDAITRKQ